MKQSLFLILLLCGLQTARARDLGVYQHGTVVRMRMGDCLPEHPGFAALAGGPQTPIAEACPEYTLLSDKVVFVIVGRSSNQLLPLADVIDFRLRKSVLWVRLDDAKHESKFGIKEMTLRSEWEMVQKHITEQLNGLPNLDGMLTMRNRD